MSFVLASFNRYDPKLPESRLRFWLVASPSIAVLKFKMYDTALYLIDILDSPALGALQVALGAFIRMALNGFFFFGVAAIIFRPNEPLFLNACFSRPFLNSQINKIRRPNFKNPVPISL